MRLSLYWLACLCVYTSMAWSQAPNPMSLVDFLSLEQIVTVDSAPDGSTTIYSKVSANWKANARVEHLWARRGDGPFFQLTNGTSSEKNGRISPNGQWVAFLAKRATDKAAQLYVISVNGGEALRLTSHPTAVQTLAWGDDSTQLFFSAPDSRKTERQQRARIGDDLIRVDSDHAHHHIWSINALGGEAQRLTGGAFSTAVMHIQGGRILHSRQASPLLNDWPTSDLWIMDLDGGNAQRLTSNTILESEARLSPDGQSVAFIARALSAEGTTDYAAGDGYYNPKVFTLAISGNKPAALHGADFRGAALSIRWHRDGDALFVRANIGLSDQLYKLSLTTGDMERLTAGKQSLTDWAYSQESDSHIIVAASDISPGSLYKIQDRALESLTPDHASLESKFLIPKSERVIWTGEDGVEVDGILVYPLGYQKGQRYPLVVQTHGGPASSDQWGNYHPFNYRPVLAAQGFAVFTPNYRGSTGYGDAFLRDMVGGYFRHAHKDVLRGIDQLIERGIADPERLIKMGWSAGGHMTNKLVTVTDRFAAASSGAGAANWLSMVAQSDLRFLRSAWFGGTPWQENAPIETYWEHSPVKDVRRITTPVLFMVGAADERVPPAQSLEMFRAMKSLGLTAELYMAPGEGHGWSKLSHRLLKANLELEWFARHALDSAYIWEQPPTVARGIAPRSAIQLNPSR